MDIFIAGIVHSDVLGPDRLKKWFQEFFDINRSSPEFVAIEWDEVIFNQIISQRSSIREYAKAAWPEASSDFLDKIELSLGYEGDTHNRILTKAETLWLDQGRPVPNRSIVSEYAKDRMKIYERYISESPDDFGHKTLLHMSRKAWARSSPNEAEGSERDIKFSEVILSRLNKSKSNWAIVVIGASHARSSRGFMAKHLEEAGLSCHITVLSPI